MAILSSMINAASCFYPELMAESQRASILRCRQRGCFTSADHCGFRLSEIARVADHLSQARIQVHRELPAHDVFAAVFRITISNRKRLKRWI